MNLSEKLGALSAGFEKKSYPPGRVKIADALRNLLEKKAFNAITTAEISRQAGVTEALIYKYFKDKRDLLNQVLSEYLEEYCALVQRDLRGIKGALNKIRKLIWSHISVYATNRVFARILLIEARNHSDYYHSDTYELVKVYSDVILEILEEGIQNNEIRDDIPIKLIRQIILGSIEQVCLTGITFDREIDPDILTDEICEIIFKGIVPDVQAGD